MPFRWKTKTVLFVLLVMAPLQGCSGPEPYVEYKRLCEQAGTVIERRIPAVKSFVDVTGNGCSLGCWSHLHSRNIEFVEIEFNAASYAKLVRGNDRYAVGNRIPPTDGTFEVTRTPEQDCSILDEFRDNKRDPAGRPYCLKFRKVEGPVRSFYSYAEREIRRERAGASLSGTQVEVRDRRDGKIVARTARYHYYGLTGTLWPMPEDSSCNTTWFMINDAFAQ